MTATKDGSGPFGTELQSQKYLHSLWTRNEGQLLPFLNSCGSPKALDLMFQFS